VNTAGIITVQFFKIHTPALKKNSKKMQMFCKWILCRGKDGTGRLSENSE